MKRRGSAMVFVIVMTVAMAGVVVATMTLTSAGLKSSRVWEDQTRMRYALDGAAEQIVVDYANGAISTLPATRNTTIADVPMTLSIAAHDTMPRVMRVTGTMTYHGRSITETRLVGMRRMPSPFFYAVFSNAGLSTSGVVNTGSGGTDGDIYANGAISLTGSGGTVNGDLESTSTVSAGSTTVVGTVRPNASAVTFPAAASATEYSSVSNATSNKPSLSGYTFSETANEYFLLYCSGNTSISGSFRGRGTIYVNGTATISGAMSYYDSYARVAIIANSVSFSSTAMNAVGYFYGGTGGISVSAQGMTLTRGALVGSSLTFSGPVSVVNDPAVWVDSNEGRKHRLPGFYP